MKKVETQEERVEHNRRVEELRALVRQHVLKQSGFDAKATKPEEFIENLRRAEPWVKVTVEAMALEMGEALAVGREAYDFGPESVDEAIRLAMAAASVHVKSTSVTVRKG